jgi:hypothetical protein
MRSLLLPLVSSIVLAACGGALAADVGEEPGASKDEPTASQSRPVAPEDDTKEREGGKGHRDGGDATPREPPLDLSSFPELAECMPSPYETHVRTTAGGLLPAGSFGIDGGRGTWSSRVIAQVILEFDIESTPAWGWACGDMSSTNPLGPGTFIVGDRFPYASVQFEGHSCGAAPGSSFTIVDYATKGPTDQATLTRFVAWFNLVCQNGGTVQGCIRYGR